MTIVSEGDVVCTECGAVCSERMINVVDPFSNHAAVDRPKPYARPAVPASTSPVFLNLRYEVSAAAAAASGPESTSSSATSTGLDAEGLKLLTLRISSDYNKVLHAGLVDFYRSKNFPISEPVMFYAMRLYFEFRERSTTSTERGRPKTFRGNPLKGIKCACLYYALILAGSSGEARSKDEIARVYDIELRHVNAGIMKLTRLLPHLATASSTVSTTDVLDVDQYEVEAVRLYNEIHKYVSVPFQIKAQAIALTTWAVRMNYFRTNMPKTVIAAVFWALMQDRSIRTRSQKDVVMARAGIKPLHAEYGLALETYATLAGVAQTTILSLQPDINHVRLAQRALA